MGRDTITIGVGDDVIAVTSSPGLIGSLLVGVSFARALAFALKKPLMEVDHIKAHLYANFLRFKGEGDSQCHCESQRFQSGRSNLLNSKEIASSLRSAPRNDTRTDSFSKFPSLPAIGLVVSGGHSSLFHVKNFNRCILLGQTRDDAAGEAYDKVARILGLGYPGGPIVDRLAKEGINKQIRFPSADLPGTFDFSFSGVKTAVLYHLKKNKALDESSVKRIAYAFQESVVSVLVEKSITACKKKKVKTLLIGGGVAANSVLRQKLQWRGREEQINVFFPPLSLCMDNAAMIAGLAYHVRK